MRENYKKMLVGLLALNTAMSLWAVQPFQPVAQKPWKKSGVQEMHSVHTLPRVADEIPTQTVVEEDFSNFTAGTEIAPDEKNIGGPRDYTYHIDPGFMKLEGWTGSAIHQAGGACAITSYMEPNYDYEVMGFLSTPEMELYGECTVTFRAKRLASSPDKGYLWLALCDNMQGPVDEKTFELTTEWGNYSFTSYAATFNNRNIFQFTPKEAGIIVDDITVFRKRNRIPSPSINPSDNVSQTEFVASWHSTPTADSYLLNVYYKALPEGEKVDGTLVEGFDKINADTDGNVNTANPGYPDGWTVDLRAGKNKLSKVEGTFNSAPQALLFDAVGDSLVSPVMPAPFKKLSFWIKPSSMNDSYEEMSLIGVSILHKGGRWEHIANLPASWLEEEGGFYDFGGEDFGDDVVQVKFWMIQKGNVDFYMDDVTIEYATLPVPYAFIENEELTDTFRVVKDLNMEYDYYYYVQAKEGKLLSETSAHIWVDRIVGIKPEALPASDLSENGFTANWNPLVNAQSYTVNLYEFTETEKDNQEVTLLSEDFDLVTEGTVDNPMSPSGWNYMFSLWEEELTKTDWNAAYLIWAKGMVGGKAGTEYSTPGIIFTPAMLLADGGDIIVDFSALTKKKEDEIAVVIMDNMLGNQGIMAYSFKAGEDGTVTGSARFESKYVEEHMTPGKYYYVAFMTSNGGEFFIDKVRVAQTRKAKGEKVYGLLELAKTDDRQFVFNGLTSDRKYAYDVQASCTRQYMPYASEKSDPVVVSLPSSIECIKGHESEIKVYAADGKLVVDKITSGRVSVYNAQGQLVTVVPDDGMVEIALPSGLYLVHASGQVCKAFVK